MVSVGTEFGSAFNRSSSGVPARARLALDALLDHRDFTTRPDRLTLFAHYVGKADREAFLSQYPECETLDSTRAGRDLMHFFTEAARLFDAEIIAGILCAAHDRMVRQARGNVIVCGRIAGDPSEGLLRRVCLPALLENPAVTTINRLPKQIFAPHVTAAGLDAAPRPPRQTAVILTFPRAAAHPL